MAVLAIAGVGAAIGAGAGIAANLAIAGVLSAASIGFSIGTLAGNLLFPQKTTQEGARLGDLSVTSSAFGAVRPIGYGKIRVAGNVIWAAPIREQKATQNQGGKGGPQVSSTTYSYYGTFALALCEGPAAAVLRIWADSKLVYDATSGSDTIKKPGFNFRFYPGDENQVADSIIEADKGVGNVPGYRGTCYLVFDDIPLADYGNRLPNITAEVVFSASPDFSYTQLIPASPSIFGGTWTFALGVDLTRRLGYIEGSDPNGIIVFDISTMQVIREVAMTDILADGTDGGGSGAGVIGHGNTNLLVGPDGALYFSIGGRIVRVDQNTLKETASFPASQGGLGQSINSATHFPFALYLAPLSYFDPTTGEQKNFLVEGGFFATWGVLEIPSLAYTEGDGATLSGTHICGLVGGKVELGVGDVWALSADAFLGSASRVYIDRIRAEWDSVLGFTPGSGITRMQMAAFAPTDIDPAAVSFNIAGGDPSSLSYDESDDTLLFQVSTYSTDLTVVSGAFLVKWSPSSGIVYSVRSADSGGWPALPSRISGGTFAKFYVDKLLQIDTATGAVKTSSPVDVVSGGWPLRSGGGAQVYDSDYQTVLAAVSVSSGWAKIRLGRSIGQATTLGAIITDQCHRAGFAAGDSDASTVTDAVEGFVISQRATVIDVLTPLLGAFLVDAVESDYTLAFRHRGGAMLTTVTQDELIRTSDTTAEPYTETRQQEIELPMRVTMTYIDTDRDFQTNTQAAKRVRNPDPTVFSDNQSDVNLAVVTTATAAKQMAEKLLFTAWNERHSFALRLPPKYGYLDPADPIFFVLNDGYTLRARLSSTNIGVDYSLDTKLIGESDGQYVSTAAADAGVPWAGSHTISEVYPSELILLDVPLLRDIDDMGGRAIRGYWAGSAFQANAAWPGAALQQSTDTATWDTLDASSSEATWGYVDSPPADTPALFSTQYDGALTVAVVAGGYVPSAVTDLDMANGANPIALIKTNGAVEIIQYRDVSALGNGRYSLSVLRRGQRGSDTMAGGHVSGEMFVFLDTASISGLQIPLGQRNASEFYRAVTNGTFAQSAALKSFTFHGRDQMPYAPVDFARAPSGSDLVVSWKRRTRIGGWLVDGSDTVPLNEASEAYEAYVLASAAAFDSFDPTVPASYVRAFTGLTSAQLTYTAAMMTSDGFTPASDTLYLAVYQLSAVVGRGFAGYQALPAF